MTSAAEYKVLLVGDSGVGKTSLLAKARNLKFEKMHNPTMGVEVSSLQPQGSYSGSLVVWDTAGKEIFSALRDAYYIKAHAVIFVYDGTNELSQKNLLHWAEAVRRVEGIIPSVIVRNKCDISPQVGAPFTGEMRTSAKDSDSDDVFSAVLALLTERITESGSQ